jgi:hypothetical protein
MMQKSQVLKFNHEKIIENFTQLAFINAIEYNHLPLVPRLRMHGAIPPVPHISSW